MDGRRRAAAGTREAVVAGGVAAALAQPQVIGEERGRGTRNGTCQERRVQLAWTGLPWGCRLVLRRGAPSAPPHAPYRRDRTFV